MIDPAANVGRTKFNPVGLFGLCDEKLARLHIYSPQIMFYSRKKIQEVTGPIIKN